MKNIGLLLTKNEAPILRESIKANTKFIKDIYVLDGSDDETESILKEFKEVKCYIHERDIPQHEIINDGNIQDDRFRGVIFREILKDCNVGDWVTIMHGDEIFYHDPNMVAAMASTASYNSVPWFSPHFFLTTDDLSKWSELKDKPLQERVTWYATNKQPWIEYRQFQILQDSHYDSSSYSRVIPSTSNMSPFPICPIYKHFKVWNPEPDLYEVVYSEKYKRNISREKGKWGFLHWEINSFEDFFVEYYPGYSEKHKFVDNFGRFEEPINAAFRKLNDHLAANNIKLCDIVENISSQD